MAAGDRDVTLIIGAIDQTKDVFNAISLGAAASLGLAVKTAVDFDTAVNSASRALDLSAKEVAGFVDQTKAIAPALGLAPSKFAELSAAAGKLGVAKGDIVAFSKNIAELGLITDSTETQTVELASAFAAIKTITGATNPQLAEAGALFNALDDKIGGNVRGITEFVRQTAAAGKLLKLSIGDLGAYGATFGALGVKEAVAYRSFNSLLTKLAAPQTLGRQGRAGLEALGIGSEDLAKRMTTDAKGGIDFFLGKIRELAKTDVSAALGAAKMVIGADFADEILTLALASDKYKEALALVGDKTGNLAKKQEELAKKTASVKGQMAIAGATLQVLGINLGNALLPAIVGILQAITPLVKGFADLVAANPFIGTLTVGVLLLVAAIAPLVSIAGTLSTVFTALSPIIAGVASLFAAATGIGLLPFIAGAIAVAAAAALILTNWGGVSSFFAGIGSAISFCVTQMIGSFSLLYNSVSPIISGFVGMIGSGVSEIGLNFLGLITLISNSVINPLANLAIAAFNGAIAIGAAIVSGISQATAPLFGYLNQVYAYISNGLISLANSAAGWGASIINQLTSGISAAFGGLVTNLQSHLSYLRSFLPSSDAERGALSDLSKSGASLWQTFAGGLKDGLSPATSAIASGASQLLPSPSVTSPSSAGGNTSIVINFSPSVTGNTTPDLVEALRAESRRLLEMLRSEGLRLDRGNL